MGEVNIKSALLKFRPYFLQAREQNLNEADTVLRLVKFCEEVLGYNPLTEVSREAEMKGKYIDFLLRIEGIIKLLVEAKAAGVALRDKHIEQAYTYASRNNFRWVLLTNGVEWNLYHLTFEEGIEYDRAFAVDLSDEQSLAEAATLLGLLHRRAMRDDALEKFWQKRTALNPMSLARAIFHEDTLLTIRRLVRKDLETLVPPEDLAEAIRSMLNQETREQIGQVRIRRTRRKVHRDGEKLPVQPESGESNPPITPPPASQ